MNKRPHNVKAFLKEKVTEGMACLNKTRARAACGCSAAELRVLQRQVADLSTLSISKYIKKLV